MAKTEQRKTAKSLYMAGKNQKEIAKLLGLTEKTVSNWVNKYGWKQEREARVLGKTTQEDNLRQLVSNLASKVIKLENEMEIARRNDDTNKQLGLQTEINRCSDQASKWNKQLESLNKENRVPLITYLKVMDELFEAIRQHNPKLYLDLVEFQEEHLTAISVKLG